MHFVYFVYSDHIFDVPERKSENPRRKKGTVTGLDQPAKGCKGVRVQRYTVDESKILPHIRAGVALDTL